VPRLKLPLAICLAGALVDDVLTYLYVKEWGIYVEANPIIISYWLDKPFWLWILRELVLVAIAIAMSFGYRKFIEYLMAKTSNLKSSKTCMKIMNLMKRGWLWPLWLAAIIRIMPAFHNILLIFFGVETPLSKIINQIMSSFIFWALMALMEAMSAWRGTSHEPSSSQMVYLPEPHPPDPLSVYHISHT